MSYALTTDGFAYEIGETGQEFTIQSISKSFTYGMILDEHGIEKVEKRIGVEQSGEAFNSISLDFETGMPLHPIISAGANVMGQNDDPDHICFPAKGSVSIFHQASKTDEKGRRINAFGRGVCFGEIAAIDQSKWSANVWAD